ncbi:MAG TPA: aldehyde dehydrogenase family protein [Chloroflexota bacterium]|nr:aldehyde dehydrogenase family protein [Chloroflexota bacterium]
MTVTDEAPAGTIHRRALINGEWVEGSQGSFEVKSPFSGDVLGTVTACGPDDVDRAVAAARAAQPGWASVPLLDRVDLMYRAYALCKERNEEIAQTITREMGKTIRESREEMVQYACEHFRRAAEDVLRYRGQVLPSTEERTNNKRLLVTRRPAGVVGVITPWNFPVDIAAISICYAVAIGDTVVWKPSEYAPLSSAMLADIFVDAGFPPGVVNMVTGAGEVGAAIVEHDDVDVIAFTGNTATGERIARSAGLKRLLLELGGNGPIIVMPDADLDKAVEASILGCFYLAGQCCTAAERILVHDAVHDEFVRRLEDRTRRLRVGDPADDATDMGPLCNAGTLRKVRDHIKDARDGGATVTEIGVADNLLYPPTILTEVTEDMVIARDETFGPVAPIIRFSDPSEAIRIANGTPFGLNAALFTNSLSDAWRMAERLEHGTVLVNESTNYWDQLGPFGGAKKSGVGRELSTWMLDALTEIKHIVFDIGTDDHSHGGGAA